MTTSTSSSILTVSQLTHAIKVQLESQFQTVRLQGEISNFKRQSSGHLYFSLKDRNAQIGAVMFRGSASSLKALPKDGDEVVVRAEISVYPPRGNYQLVVRELALAGVGELLQKLEELKIKIHRMGWFRQEHKKPLPKSPRRIGIITSPTGAAIRDILNVLERRHSGLHIILNPVKVQGQGSAEEIAQAIRDFNRHNSVDVMIVGRGGGSIEDLWAFNEEIVADAVFHSNIPIISAVGHETDHCICDYVADMRAPTPSAAAEIITAEKAQILHTLHVIQQRFHQTLRHLLSGARQRLDGILRQPMLSSPYSLLAPHLQRLDDLRDGIDQHFEHRLMQLRLRLQGMQRQASALQPTTQIQHYRQKLEQSSRALDQLWRSQQVMRRQKLEQVVTSLELIDPKNLLKKGYTILFAEKDQSVITSVQALQVNQSVSLLFGDGRATATIQQVDPHE